MKLLESPNHNWHAGKRICSFDDGNDKFAKRFMFKHNHVGADVIQDNLQQEYIKTGVSTLSIRHCKQYPVNAEIIDGLCPWPQPTPLPAHNNTVVQRVPTNTTDTQVKTAVCARCRNGESGHSRHIQ